MNHPKNEHFAKWAEEIKESDRNAFDDLFRSVYPQLVKFAASYTKEKSSACDIVQDAFVALWQKRKTINPDLSLKAYMYQIVRNRALNHLRDTSAGISQPEMIAEETLQAAEQIETGRHADGLAEKFREWIGELPERQREAFELSRFEGLSHQEIATVMEVSPKTVNNHIVAAIGQLRICYDRYSEEKKQV